MCIYMYIYIYTYNHKCIIQLSNVNMSRGSLIRGSLKLPMIFLRAK